MKKRYEEARANMKGKMLNCLVVAVVLLAVSALSGAVICVQGNGHPPGPEPNKIDVISVVPSSIPADGTSVATIKARAMKDNDPSNNYTLTFKIMLEPLLGNVYLSTTDPVHNYGKEVGNVTNDDGYAYATLKAGDVAGDVEIEVYRGNVSNTVVVTVGVGIFPQGVAITPDGALAYVTNAGSATVNSGFAPISVIETATMTTVDAVNVGAGTVGVAITPF